MAECLDFNGNSIVVFFAHDLLQVAIGHDTQGGSDKFFGGKFSAEDAVRGPLTSEAEVAHACGLREVYREAGITGEQLDDYRQIGDEPIKRNVPNHETGGRIWLSTYVFCAVAKKNIELPVHTIEETEMSNRRFTPVVNVLRSGLLPRRHKDKFNPFHAKYLVNALHLLRRLTSDGNPAYDRFRTQLFALKLCGFDIDWYQSMIDNDMRRRRI